MRLEGEHLWIGTYPDCRLRRITVASGEILDFGRIGASTYMVGIALDEDHVYASTAAPGELKVFDHQGNLLHDLTEHLVESPVGTLKVIAHEGLLYVSVGRAVLSMRPNGTERVERPIPDEDRYVDHFDITPDGRLIALARNTTNYYEVTPDGLECLGAPSSDLQNVGFTILEDGTLVGVSGIGHIWTTQLGGEASIFSTAETDFGYPETVQSVLAHSSSSVWVGGHFALTKHSPSPRPRGRLIDPDRYRPGRIPTQRLDVNGEPKSLLEIDDGTVLAGLYPSTDVIAVHPDTLEIRTLGTIGHEQMRPMAMAWDADRRTALVATTASQQIHTGALTFVDVESGDMDVRNFLPGQNTRALTVDGDFAYLAGDVYAEGTGEHPLEGGIGRRDRSAHQGGHADLRTQGMGLPRVRGGAGPDPLRDVSPPQRALVRPGPRDGGGRRERRDGRVRHSAPSIWAPSTPGTNGRTRSRRWPSRTAAGAAPCTSTCPTAGSTIPTSVSSDGYEAPGALTGPTWPGSR